MKIVALQAENIKKLVAIEIRPDGNIVQITGKNGAGKTSVLDSIWWALGGTENVQLQPIRKGCEEARIRLDLGELVVTRHFKAGKTSTIKVENAEGAKYPSPQAMLDKLLSALSFDPLAFARMKPREQFDELRRFVPGVDFEAIEREQAGDYERRAERNRAARDARTRLTAIAPAAAGEPTEAVNTGALVTKLEEAGRHNADIETRKGNRERLTARAAQRRKDAERLRAEAEALRLQAKARDGDAATADAEGESIEAQLIAAGELPEPIDTAEIRTSIDAAERANHDFDVIRAREANRAEQTRLAQVNEQEAAALTAAMAKRDADRLAAIAAAKLPVAGITFGTGVVLLNELPFEQASDAEQLRASIAIAMAANPKLRVLRVRDGSLLDTDSLLLLQDMADLNDFQVWIERVDDSGKVGFVLEDGHLKAPEDEAPEPGRGPANIGDGVTTQGKG